MLQAIRILIQRDSFLFFAVFETFSFVFIAEMKIDFIRTKYSICFERTIQEQSE